MEAVLFKAIPLKCLGILKEPASVGSEEKKHTDPLAVRPLAKSLTTNVNKKLNYTKDIQVPPS